MKKVALIVLLFISISLSAQSQNDSLKLINKQIEIELLKQRNQDLINYQDTLSANIYWSLGFAATFLILFLGVNIFFLKNRYAEDKERFLKYIDDAISLKVVELNKSTIENVDKALNSRLSPLNNNIRELKEALSNNVIKINDLKIDILLIKNSNKDIILNCYFEHALACRNTGDFTLYGWKISSCLDEMKKLLIDGAEFYGHDITDVTKFLDSLPNQFSDAVYSFREVLRKVNV